eukprot:1126113-Prymnesium_polylepis.1
MVVNLRHSGAIFDVYVGRICSGSPPSDGVWGNPYKMADWPHAERDRVVTSHRRQFLVRPEWAQRARAELRGRRLACWCVARPPR